MSDFRIKNGRGPVPAAPATTNQQQIKITNPNSTIRSATWGSKYAGPGERVTLNIKLGKPPVRSTAKAEIFINVPGSLPRHIESPVTFPINGFTGTGSWIAKVPPVPTAYYTFRVWVDGQSQMSDELRVANDPVAVKMRKLNSDGWDG